LKSIENSTFPQIKTTTNRQKFKQLRSASRFDSPEHFPCGISIYLRNSNAKMKLKNGGPKVDSSIFESFNKLTSEDEGVRIKGASGLVKILEETSEDKVSDMKKCARRSNFMKPSNSSYRNS
jgi:hypothetical protein